MRIDGAAYIVDLARPEAVRKEGASADAARGARPAGRVTSFDRVEISSRSRELERLKRDLAALPEVRLDRVALARQSLKQGGYRVEPAVLAQKMLETVGTVKGEEL